jgi:dTDP-4-amino-4,6-dideoxygalactose transaminase
MEKIQKISNKFEIPIIEDACHAILAKRYHKYAGNFGRFGCFSLHPLKNLNVWGDGGFVLLKNKKDYKKMSL